MRREIKRSWWYTTIRGIQMLLYRYWHMAWLLFLLFLVLWYFLCYRPFCSLNTNGDYSINSRINNIGQLLDSCCEGDVGVHFPADFLIITYQFDPEGGKDLDTRTEITSPFRVGPFGLCDNQNRNNQYMKWSGDNTGYGVESVMIDLTKFEANAVISVECWGFWYSELNNGNMTLDLKAYEGGKMVQDNFQFLNQGGTLSAETSFNDNIRICCSQSACNEISKIGVVRYNKTHKTLSFIPAL